MVEQERLHFLVPIAGFLTIVILMISVMVSHTTLYTSLGWSFTDLYYMLMTVLIILGLVIPFIIIGLCVLGIFTIDKNENIKKIIGLVVVIMCIILIIVGFVFVGYTLYMGSDKSAAAQVFFNNEAGMLTVAAIIGMVNTIGGVMIFRNNFLFWK